MVEIECLACGKAIKPHQLNDSDNYDTENYDGHVVCQECKSLLYVKLVKGKVQKHKVIEKNALLGDAKIKFVIGKGYQKAEDEENVM